MIITHRGASFAIPDDAGVVNCHLDEAEIREEHWRPANGYRDTLVPYGDAAGGPRDYLIGEAA